MGGASTYWSPDGHFFLYLYRASGQWQLSPRWDESQVPPMDLLAQAKMNESPGLCMEVDGSQWREYNPESGDWDDVEVFFGTEREPEVVLRREMQDRPCTRSVSRSSQRRGRVCVCLSMRQHLCCCALSCMACGQSAAVGWLKENSPLVHSRLAW